MKNATPNAPHHQAQTIASTLTAGLRSRPIVITSVTPEVDGGRYAIKREVGDDLVVHADVFKDGHDKLSVINTDLHHPHQTCIAGLDDDTLVAREVTPGSSGQTLATGATLPLAPAEVRVFVNTRGQETR